MTVEEEFLFLLQDLFEEVDGIRSVAIVSTEGLIVHSIMEEDISEIKIAAMTATILSVAERVLLEMKSGRLDVCILQGDEGNFVVMEAGRDLILATCTDLDTSMDLLFVEMSKTSEQIKNLS